MRLIRGQSSNTVSTGALDGRFTGSCISPRRRSRGLLPRPVTDPCPTSVDRMRRGRRPGTPSRRFSTRIARSNPRQNCRKWAQYCRWVRSLDGSWNVHSTSKTLLHLDNGYVGATLLSKNSGSRTPAFRRSPCQRRRRSLRFASSPGGCSLCVLESSSSRRRSVWRPIPLSKIWCH